MLKKNVIFELVMNLRLIYSSAEFFIFAKNSRFRIIADEVLDYVCYLKRIKTPYLTCLPL